MRDGQNACYVAEDPAPPPSETEVETEVETAKKSEDEGQPSGPAGGSQEEELPLPKKGYDLSFLDKLEDLEHASPAAVAAVRHAKAKGGDGESGLTSIVRPLLFPLS